jgi:hypothetical protein
MTQPSQLQTRTTRFSRRAALSAAAGGALLLPMRAFAQDEAESGDGETGIAEVPSFGARRPGPIDFLSGGRRQRGRAMTPAQLLIPDAGVDAVVEVGTISPDGVMQDPSGSWVVSWYDVLGAPGLNDNVVMAGHVDYWDVGPAVLYNVPGLQPGAAMSLIMDDGEQIDYAMESIRLYDVRTELTPEVIQTDVVGPTGREALTLITCGGEFDGTEYLQRYVVRSYKV